jgi:glycosyltransferase involved in cell wall biosynthesis
LNLLVSIAIPLLNEAESLPELLEWIDRVLVEHELKAEVILVDDGSTDESWEVIQQLSAKYPYIRGLRFARNYGKAAGLQCAFQAAQGDVLITMDADLQDSPDEIPELVRMIREDHFDLVSGWKKKRFDPISKTIPTKLYNWATRKMSGIDLHDFNCGLKAYKTRVVKQIELYGDMHRYVPVLAKRLGYDRIGEKVVQHRARKYGSTKYGLSRFIKGPLDLLTLSFMSTYGKRPMHLFGTLGILSFVLGLLMFGYIGGSKLFALWHEIPAKNIATMSQFYIALAAMIIGSQLFIGGFVAELVRGATPNRNKYVIEERIGFNPEVVATEL